MPEPLQDCLVPIRQLSRLFRSPDWVERVHHFARLALAVFAVGSPGRYALFRAASLRVL